MYVGYTIAVPSPRSRQAPAQARRSFPATNQTNPMAWTHIPVTISGFRPIRSLAGPVTSWRNPQLIGERPVTRPTCSVASPRPTRNRGSNPQAIPSFRLFTSPPWEHANKLRFLQLASAKTERNVGPAPEALDSRFANGFVSRTKPADRKRPAPIAASPTANGTARGFRRSSRPGGSASGHADPRDTRQSHLQWP